MLARLSWCNYLKLFCIFENAFVFFNVYSLSTSNYYWKLYYFFQAVGIGEIVDYGKYRQNLISTTQDAGVQTSGPQPCKNCDKCFGYTDVGVITDHGQPNVSDFVC